MQEANQTFLATIIGGLIGGICTIIGSKWSVYQQTKIQDKKEKKDILLVYFVLLNKYYNLICKSDVGNFNNIRKIIDDFDKEFNEKVEFVYYVGEKWLKKEILRFKIELEKQIEDKVTPKIELQHNILQSFEKMKSEIVKKIERSKKWRNGKK
jgi:hypothetical protein